MMMALWSLLLARSAVGSQAHDGRYQPEGVRAQPASLTDNPFYRVEIDGVRKNVFSHACQGQDARCGQETNNFVSHAMTSSPSLDAIKVVVTSLRWSSNSGSSVSIRPTHLGETGVVGDVSVLNTTGGKSISFTISEPCQLSVEVGDEDSLFPDEQAYYDFSNLLLFINPPLSQLPQVMPTHNGTTCSSSSGRACILGAADGSCDSVSVPANTDILFAHNAGDAATYYKWGDGCGDNPKQILLQEGANFFVEENAVVYARVLADNGASGVGVYGYGIVSNEYMKGHKLGDQVSNVIDLPGSDSEAFGVTVLDSTYRNIQLGSGGKLSWTKSMAWNSETDCINMKSSGGRISNNFFKNNDDCMKAYQADTVYTSNVVWHQDVGRALMFSWGNLGEAIDIDGSVQFIDTYIIHDKLGFRGASPLHPSPDNAALGLQAGMIYYSSLVNAQHSPKNHLGTASSPVLVKNLRVESRVGSLLLVTNGYAGLDNKAPWMGTNGCTGPINMEIDGLDLRYVRGMGASSVAGGCTLDASYGGVANANCICTSAIGCRADGPSGSCGVSISIKNVQESQSPGMASFQDSLVVGDNTKVSFGPTPPTPPTPMPAPCAPQTTQSIDCSPEQPVDQTACEAKGCCWRPVDPNPQNLPWCYERSSTQRDDAI